MTEFEEFEEEFKKWQDKFGLSGYQVYFKYEPIGIDFANISVQYDKTMNACVRLNSKPVKETVPFKDIKKSAKHEAIHLMLGRIAELATRRYTSKTEIDEAEEELVYKLMGLIRDEDLAV